MIGVVSIQITPPTESRKSRIKILLFKLTCFLISPFVFIQKIAFRQLPFALRIRVLNPVQIVSSAFFFIYNDFKLLIFVYLCVFYKKMKNEPVRLLANSIRGHQIHYMLCIIYKIWYIDNRFICSYYSVRFIFHFHLSFLYIDVYFIFIFVMMFFFYFNMHLLWIWVITT